jgi:predicted DNA-binding transcriptional regulator AlpA
MQEKRLLKPREAAARLSISERTLWSNTFPRGNILAVRIGNCVRYSAEALQAYIDSQQQEGQSGGVTQAPDREERGSTYTSPNEGAEPP